MADGAAEEKLPTGSVTASWIELDESNGGVGGDGGDGSVHTESSSTEGTQSPQYSDNDSNGEKMTAELADASRSYYKSTSGEDKTATNNETANVPSQAASKSSSDLVYLSTLMLTHSVALIIGLVIGRKFLSSGR